MSKVRFCEVCKQPIEPERAEQLSETRLCRTHAEEIQKYGGVTTASVRNQEAIDRLRDDDRARQP